MHLGKLKGCKIKYKSTVILLLMYLTSLTTYAIHPIVILTGGINFLDPKPQNLSFANTVFLYRPLDSTPRSALIGGSLGAEFSLNPSWIWQLGLAFYQSTTLSQLGEEVQAPMSNLNAINTWNYQYKILNRQVLLENKFLFALRTCYHPYLIAGLGESFNYTYGFQVTPQNSGEVATAIFDDHQNKSFIYTMGLGLDIDLMEKIRLGVGYRYSYLGAYNLGKGIINTGAGGSIFFLPALKSAHSLNHQMQIQLTYFI